MAHCGELTGTLWRDEGVIVARCSGHHGKMTQGSRQKWCRVSAEALLSSLFRWLSRMSFCQGILCCGQGVSQKSLWLPASRTCVQVRRGQRPTAWMGGESAAAGSGLAPVFVSEIVDMLISESRG